jgi:hypothetical protein
MNMDAACSSERLLKSSQTTFGRNPVEYKVIGINGV